MTDQKFSMGKSFYQREPLTTRLKNLIHDYPEGVGIVKELVQNADDAGASLVHITFDWRVHEYKNLPDIGMSKLMGAAILVYNDSVFLEEDFNNIQNLGEGGKKKTLWKTGRFGVGFNSVYHVTDYPSFISKDRIVFFDPHASDVDAAPLAAAFQELTQGEAGRSWALDEWWNHPEFMKVYEAGGLQHGETDFKGTLFRLPLRTEEHAKYSKIRNQAFTRSKNIKPLINDLAKVGEELLLFLKSVVEIRIFTIEVDGSHHETLSIMTENSDEVITERKRISASLLGDPEDFFEACRTLPDNLPAVSYVHKIKTESFANNKQKETLRSIWRVASLIRVDEKGEILSVIDELRKQNEKAVPWAGAAARIQATSTSGKVNPFVGKSYCFLPLAENGLPIHINGFFDLDSSRSKLTSAGNMSGRDESRVRWNQLLVRHVLSFACANLISNLVNDIGQTDPSLFYSFWAVSGIKEKALEELPTCLVEILDNRKVILTTNQSKWLEPCQVWVLPRSAQHLTEPLSNDGISLPEIPIPPVILDAFKKADLALSVFSPKDLAEHLKMQGALGVPLEDAPKDSLRKLSWVKDLLKYYLSDKGCRDLKGLPLAVLSDGTLQVFGNNPCGNIYDGKDNVREIFATHKEWFIDQDFIKSVSSLSECDCITDMDAVVVADRLSEIIDVDYYNNEPWEPNGDNLPNAEWLSLVYKYFVGQETLPVQQLIKVPLVPAKDGKLHQGGNSMTPLWCNSSVDYDTKVMLAYFDIPLIEAPRILSSEISKFISQHSNQFIWELTVPDLIDTLASYQNNLPAYEKYFYDFLLVFLCDRSWFKGEGKDDTDRREKLAKLRIYPTHNEQLASLDDENGFIARDFIVPNIDLGIQFYKLGIENEEWYPLFQFLDVNELGIADFISDYLLVKFSSLEEGHQLHVMQWLRKNAQQILSNTSLKQIIGSTPLVRSQDGNLHQINKLYNPNCIAIGQLHLTNVPIPDLSFYALDEEDSQNWLYFFEGIGMHSSMSPQQVACYLKTLINWNNIKDKKWEPQGDQLPNVEWLSRIYNYFSNQDEIPNDELREIPIVPGNDEKLHCGGCMDSPLWSNVQLTEDVKKMLAYFHIPVMDVHEILKPAVTRFFNCPNQQIIFAITTSDLIDTLSVISKQFPSYGQHNRKHYKTLVDFLADPAWIDNEGKADQERHKILRELKIYLTTTDELVSLIDPNIFIAGADDVPKVSAKFRLLQLGSDQQKQNWKPLFNLLNVPILDRAKIIKEFLVPSYKTFSQAEQKNVLLWIRDNLSLAQTEQEKAGDTSLEIRKIVRETPLIFCEDNKIRPAFSIYHPLNYELAREILGDKAHTPNMGFYKENEDRWKDFFRSVGMLHSPTSADLLVHIQALIKLARSENTDRSLMKIFSHVVENYERLSKHKISGYDKTIIDFLKDLAWLPVELSQEKLKKIPCHLKPVPLFYRPTDVCLPRFALVIASQRPIFIISKEPEKEVREGLGFREPDKDEIVNHLKSLIEFWKSPPIQISKELESNFQNSLNRVYQYLGNIFIRANDVEKLWLQNELSEIECLWDYSQFWKPKHTFQVPVPYFGKYRTKINDPKIRDIYGIIGQKYEPDIEDYLEFIEDLADSSNGNYLSAEDIRCAYEVLQRISKLLENKSITCDYLSNLLLLTDDGLLLPPEQIFIPDSPTRLKAIGEERNSIKLLYKQDLWYLGSAMRCLSLQKDITEEPKSVTRSTDSEALRFCRHWQKLIISHEFVEGVERLVFDEYSLEDIVDMDFSWLKSIDIIASAEILTDLMFHNSCIASGVLGAYFLDGHKFYIRVAKESTMRRFLADCLNIRLKEYGCQIDKSNLQTIFESSTPKDIEQSLDELGIRAYKKQEFLDTQTEEIEIEEDSIFDDAFPEEDFTDIFESDGNINPNPQTLIDRNSDVEEHDQPDQSNEPESKLSLLKPQNNKDDAKNVNTPINSEKITSFSNSSNPLVSSQQTNPIKNTGNTSHHSISRPDSNQFESTYNDKQLSQNTVNPSTNTPSRQSIPSSKSSESINVASRNQQYRHGVRASSGLAVEVDIDPEESFPQDERDKIDRAGVACVINYELQQGRNPRDMNEVRANFPGYDIESTDPKSGEIRYIEIKSLRGDWGRRGVKVTRKQFETGGDYQDSYWLYVVERSEMEQEYSITTIQNPVGLVGAFFYDVSWKQLNELVE